MDPYTEDPTSEPYTPNMPDLAGQEQQFRPPPGIPVQYTQADDLNRQRYEHGYSGVQEDMDNGRLHPEYGEPLLQAIGQKLQGFYQRRQAAQQQAQQEQQMEAMHQNAQMTALRHMDMEHAAKGFSAQMAHETLVDQFGMPQRVSFYQKKPGEWEQVNLPDNTNDTWPEAQMGNTQANDDHGEPGIGIGGGADFGEPDANAGMGGGEPTDVSGALPETLPKPQVKQNSDGTQQMTIWNGAYRTEAVYGPNKQLIGQQTFAPNGQPVQTDPPADDGRGQFYSQATQMVGPPPQQYLRGVHGQQIPNPQYGAWQRAVHGQAAQLLKDDVAIKKEQRIEDAKEIKAEVAERGKMFHSRLDVLRQERNQLLKDKVPKVEWPEELQSDSAIIAKAREQVTEALGGWSPKLRQHYKKTGVWSDEAKATAANPPATPETPQQQLDTAKSIIKGLPKLDKPRPRSVESEINDPNP